VEALGVLSTVLVACMVVLLWLWLRAEHNLRRHQVDRAAAEYARVRQETSLAEQHGRLGIIREHQDVAVVAISRLITRAEGARYAATRDPTSAVRAITALVDDGRGALADMRRVLAIAREGESGATVQPGLRPAEELFQSSRDAGLTVQVEESGDRFSLKPGAELAVYRILQGALDNALQHGGPGTVARVLINWTSTGLQLIVDDDGIQAAARRLSAEPDDIAALTAYTIDDDLAALSDEGAGAGLTRMRERAELFGGVFHAGTVPGVGFSVSAVFPSLRFHNGVHGVNLAAR
jgi:signal transduction histidine kinase